MTLPVASSKKRALALGVNDQDGVTGGAAENLDYLEVDD